VTGAVAASTAVTLLMPFFLATGGRPMDGVMLGLIDVTLIGALAILWGPYLAAPSARGDGASRAAVATTVSWVVFWIAWLVFTVVGTAAAAGPDGYALMRAFGVLLYGVIVVVLLSPVALFIGIQLAIASCLSGRPATR
jgi:hypothetical protein